MNIKFIFSAIVVLLLYTGAVNAQVVLTAQEAVLSEQDKAYFDLHIKNQNYAVFTLDTSELLDSLRTHEYCNVQLYISEQWNWTFYLVPDKRWTGTGAVTCEGKTANNEPVIISIGKDFYGIVHSNKGDYLIRPIWLFTQNFDDKSLIAFKVSDLFEISNDEADFDLPVSIHFNQTSNMLNIKHNTPAQERMHLKTTILNTQGQAVKFHEATGSNTTLSLEELDSGIYFIQVTAPDSGKSIIKPIVVQK